MRNPFSYARQIKFLNDLFNVHGVQPGNHSHLVDVSVFFLSIVEFAKIFYEEGQKDMFKKLIFLIKKSPIVSKIKKFLATFDASQNAAIITFDRALEPLVREIDILNKNKSYAVLTEFKKQVRAALFDDVIGRRDSDGGSASSSPSKTRSTSSEAS